MAAQFAFAVGDYAILRSENVRVKIEERSVFIGRPYYVIGHEDGNYGDVFESELARVPDPDNCVNMTAVRFGNRVTITVTSNAGNKSSATVDASDPLYVWFLRVADHELLWDNPIHPRDYVISERQMEGEIAYAEF